MAWGDWQPEGNGGHSCLLGLPIPQATSNTAQHPPRLGAESDLQNAVPDLFGEDQLGVCGNRQQRLTE